ncbi:MAG: hypothetical protein ABUS79_13460 [Pseudomonadota bacterium]
MSGCFEVKYGDCRVTCTVEQGCPANLTCLVEQGAGLCAPPGTTTCHPQQHLDAATDRADAGEAGLEAEAGAAGPPLMLCHNGSCLTLPETIRKNLVLLLWPSNLPALGSPVSVWADQSGQGNDAHALYPTAPPHVIPNGVQLDSTQLGSGFVVANSPSLDFGPGDFAVIVAAGLSSSASPVSFFRKSDGARTNSRQISIDWVLSTSIAGQPQGAVNDTLIFTTANIAQPSVGAYTLQRATNHVELHLNGAVLGSSDLPAGGSTTNAADAFVGVRNMFGSPADSIEAVIAIRGSVGSSDLNAVESFLKTLFARAP